MERLGELRVFENVLRARLLRRFRCSPADVDDILQETFARIFTGPAELMANVRSLQAYASTIARNAIVDHYRHSARLERLRNAVISEYEPSAEELASLEEQLEHLLESIEALPTKRRQVLVLRKIYGYSQREVAILLRIADHTVERHVAKAALALKLTRTNADCQSELRIPFKRHRVS